MRMLENRDVEEIWLRERERGLPVRSEGGGVSLVGSVLHIPRRRERGAMPGPQISAGHSRPPASKCFLSKLKFGHSTNRPLFA